MQRILITGATGFVGRHLVERLLKTELDLTLAVRSRERCPAGWAALPWLKIVETGPLEKSTNLDDAFEGVGAIIHIAGLAHQVRAETDGGFAATNSSATARLARAALDHGAGSFIHLSSLASVTDNAASRVVDDNTADAPPTAYGRSKRAAEEHVEKLAGSGVFAVSLRPPLVVGADARGNWAALQRLAATGLPLPFASVRGCRSMIGVGSLVAALEHLVTNRWPAESSGNYCIADAERLSLPEIVENLRTGMGLAPRLAPFPPSVMLAAARMAGRGRQASGLLGSLEVDAARFIETFRYPRLDGLPAAIRESGVAYLRLASRGAETPS